MTIIWQLFVIGNLVWSIICSYSDNYQEATFYAVYAIIGMIMGERLERLK